MIDLRSRYFRGAKGFALLFVIFIAFAILQVVLGQNTSTNWTPYQHDNRHSGTSPFVGPLTNSAVPLLSGAPYTIRLFVPSGTYGDLGSSGAFVYGTLAAPTLGIYPATSVSLSMNTTVTPDAAPTNTTSINVSTSTNFKGKLEGYTATGVVRVTDAHPAGTYPVTVTAFDSGGASSTKTFTLTVTTPATCAPISFATAANFPTSRLPTSVAVGDFNGDAKQDLAVANRGSTTVTILLGDGSGSFSAATNLPVGSNPYSVAVGDFNGDGEQDLAVANSTSNNVSILLGNGDGTFSGPFNFGVGTQPRSVAVGDFNADGKQDLAVANFDSRNVSILLGDGAGGFSAATNFGVSSSPRSVAVGDFNGDGKQDLATADFDNLEPVGNVSILLGDGAGNFSIATNLVFGRGPASVAVGDFNGDGKQDLAVANIVNNGFVSIFLGNGAGNFTIVPQLFFAGFTPCSVAVGDFNGDGKQDLATANCNGLDVSILLGDGAGSFTAATNFAAGFNPSSVAVGDFNGDGKQDLAVANEGLTGFSNLSILLRDCALTPTPTPTPSPSATPTPTPTPTPSPTPSLLSDLFITKVDPVQVVFDSDINGDGLMDIVADKATAFFVEVAVEPVEALTASTVQVELIFEGRTWTETISKTEFKPSFFSGQSRANVIINPSDRIRPTSIGIEHVFATVDPARQIPESDEANNTKSRGIHIKETESLKVAFTALSCPLPLFCYGSTQEFGETVDKSSEFIKATYPVSEGGYSAAAFPRPGLSGDPVKCLGVVDDILSIGTWGALVGANRAIGVVPAGYFRYHNIFPCNNFDRVVGVTFPYFVGGLSTEGYWTTPAHEIGHMFGNNVFPEREEYETDPQGNGNAARGFWISRETLVDPSVCFMGTGPYRTLEERWIDNGHFANLFRKLLTESLDPEILVITALLHSDSTIDLRSWYVMQNGVETESLPGDYSVRALDLSGRLLSEATLPVSFVVNLEPLGARQTDTVPLVASIRYPLETATIEILREGQPILRMSPFEKVLRDAIKAIPDYGFAANPTQRRNALLNNVDAIEQQLAVRNYYGARQKLIEALRRQVEQWLLSGFTKQTPLQMEKQEVLDVIDRTAARFGKLIE